ncbi:MAG TPA: hypothetical protein VK196_21270 [Magnetospirillum sp.]|nr:hypothetical protein [Magnetospirillum sp.]
MMRKSALLMLPLLMLFGTAIAGETKATSDADVALKAARVEAVRARLGTVSSPTASATLLEAENLLRQLRAAPPAKRDALASQLDAALSRADLEIDAASRAR